MRSNDPTYIPNELASAVVGGYVTSTEQIKDYNLGLNLEAINLMILLDSIIPSFTAYPNVIFVSVEEKSIALEASIKMESDIIIKKGSTTLKTGRTTNLPYTDRITPSSAGKITYTAEFTNGTFHPDPISRSVTVVYPIYYGALDSYNSDNLTKYDTPTTTVKRAYSMELNSTPRKIYFKVPKVNVTGISKVELFSNNNYSPVNGSINSELSDDNYNVWVSNDSYNVDSAGNRNFVVNRD